MPDAFARLRKIAQLVLGEQVGVTAVDVSEGGITELLLIAPADRVALPVVREPTAQCLVVHPAGQPGAILG
ncbi:hypothetical protein D3C86_2107850 [compost metagenome]